MGELTALELVYRDRRRNKTFWLCRCSCGQTLQVTLEQFQAQHVRACRQCRQRELDHWLYALLGTTQPHGQWTAVAFIGRNAENDPVLHCRCSCGHENRLYGERKLCHPITQECRTREDWAVHLGIARSTLQYRLSHFSLAEALTPGTMPKKHRPPLRYKAGDRITTPSETVWLVESIKDDRNNRLYVLRCEACQTPKEVPSSAFKQGCLVCAQKLRANNAYWQQRASEQTDILTHPVSGISKTRLEWAAIFKLQKKKLSQLIRRHGIEKVFAVLEQRDPDDPTPLVIRSRKTGPKTK